MILMNILGVVLIAFVVWWFFLAKGKTTKSTTTEIDIAVENGVYSPSRIEIAQNSEMTLNFFRKDGSPCAATVVFDGVDIEEELPLNQKKPVTININEPGSYPFHCQMNMYKGELIVV